MNVLREFTAIIAIAVTTYGQENVVLTPEPHAYFGSQQMPLFYEKTNIEMISAKATVKGPVQGTVLFYQPHGRAPVFIFGKLTGLEAGRHGLFVTEFGDSEQSCTKSGRIWNMSFNGVNYNGWPFIKLLGDLGTIMVCNDTTTDILNSHNFISLVPGHPANILGRGLVVASTSESSALTTISACGPIFAVQPMHDLDDI